ncbi:kinase-like domain-containing protein [Rhizophagus clarus]|uniref:Kinase-like domain-containing protein n=1 Tax=Rhizophagus clarus TaxID=94130 RepID=A0A8H3KZ20_9GLOM|nr:kinase-like domain-containing protein [Rhizophagus clarus]
MAHGNNKALSSTKKSEAYDWWKNKNIEVALKCLNNLNENLDEFLKEWDNHEKYLMKKCWNENPLKRPSASGVENIIRNWIYRPSRNETNEELESNIMEFINASIVHNHLAVELHPQACYTSRLLDFTSKKLNEILESECFDCLINDTKSSDNKTNED